MSQTFSLLMCVWRYVCGDIVQPSTESAGLVETVTQQQIVQLVRI